MNSALFSTLASVLAEVGTTSGTLAYAFGRYWPDTWVHDNPSLIRDGAYGFHPFACSS